MTEMTQMTFALLRRLTGFFNRWSSSDSANRCHGGGRGLGR